MQRPKMQRDEIIRHDDDRKIASSIFEAASWGYAIKVICRCRNEGIFEPHGLWWRFRQKKWNDDLREAAARFYCRNCSQRYGRKVRPSTIETTGEPPRIRLPMPDEREWKRAVDRYRG